MAENYRGYNLNQPNDPQWGQRENTLHKQLIDRLEDGTINDAPSDGSTYARQNSSWVDIKNAIATFNNNRYVAVNGSDTTGNGSVANPYASISHALSTITDNSPSNTYAVILAGGVYTESSTISVGAGIHVIGTGDSTVVETSNNNVNLFELGSQSDLSNVSIMGPTNAKTISVTEANSIVSIRNVKISNSTYPVYLNASGSLVNIYALAIRGSSTAFDNAVEIMDGDVNIYTLSSIGTTGNNLIYASGSSTRVHAWTIDNESVNINVLLNINLGAKLLVYSSRSVGGTTGLLLNSASATLDGVGFADPDIGIDVTNVGVSTLTITSTSVTNSTTFDMRIQNPNTVLGGLNNYLRDSKISFPNGVPTLAYSLTHFSNDEGDETQIVKAELSVGAPDRPAESTFGEGDSYTRGMLLYTYDPTNGFIDETAAAKSFSGSTFTFSDVVTDSAIYATSDLQNDGDYVKFFGVKIQIATAGVLGTGTTIAEYWNGSTWTPMSIMRTQGNSPYYPILEPLIDSDPGSYQMRFNARIDSTWVKNDPIGSGTDRYWARLRITSAITTSPEFEQIKIHSNRTEINSDGWMEYYGKARSIGRLAWNYGMVQAATSSPGDQDQFLSDTLDVGKIENSFANNTSDRVGFLAPIPFDLDTSTSIRFRWAARYSANTGDVIWNIRRGFNTAGDVVYDSAASAPTTHPTETLTTITETVPATTGAMVWHTVDIPVYDLNPRNAEGTSDILWVTIERDGTTDTFSGIAGLVAVSGDYLKWTNGGHL